MIVDETISYQALIDTIKSGNGLESLENIKFKDVYCSEALGKTKKSIPSLWNSVPLKKPSQILR